VPSCNARRSHKSRWRIVAGGSRIFGSYLMLESGVDINARVFKYRRGGQNCGSLRSVSAYFRSWRKISFFFAVTSVPFFKNLEIPFGILYIPWVTLVLTASSNAVNLTDGLDGLAAGLLAICALTLAAISYISGRVDFSDYLNIIYLPKAGELTIFSTALGGACLGFLWFNAPPAQVFMGDTGALSTGAALGTLAILLKKELLLVILGGVFVWEAISVMIQLGYFRWSKRRTGETKRFFLMAPIHHHFELKGWKETQVVIRFWIMGILFALMTFSTFKIR